MMKRELNVSIHIVGVVVMNNLKQELDLVHEKLRKEGIAIIDDTTFQVTSKSDETKSYIITTNDLNSHKTDCQAFRYGRVCNHLRRLIDNGFIEEDLGLKRRISDE